MKKETICHPNDLSRKLDMMPLSCGLKGGIYLTKNEVLSEFEKWAKEVLAEYIRLLNESIIHAESKIVEFVHDIQGKYEKLGKDLQKIILELYPSNIGLPHNQILNTIFRPVLLGCVNNPENPIINKEYLSDIVDDIRFLTNLELDKNRAWAYLHQFGCISDYIELEGLLRIRRATVVEKYMFHVTKQSVGGRTRCQFIAETISDASFIQVDESKRFLLDNKKILEEFRTLVTALRITSPSSTGLNTVSVVCNIPLGKTVVRLDVPAIFQFNPAPEIFPGAFSPYLHTQCILDKHELELFQRLHKRLREINHREGKLKERVQRALRRYDVALTSDQAEDSIVDAVIALETLFQTSGFRMAFRASYLATTDSEERRVAVKILEKCHDMRSGIVHGRISKKEKQSSLLGKLILIVCRIIRSYLYASSKNEDVINFIEDAAYNPEKLSILQKELMEWSRAETSWVWKPSESLVDLWES